MFEADSKEMPESEPLEKIKLKHLIIPFLILGAGCSVALIVFLLEMMCGKKGHQAKKAITSEDENM